MVSMYDPEGLAVINIHWSIDKYDPVPHKNFRIQPI